MVGDGGGRLPGPSATLGAATVAAFYTGHISADFAWDSFLSATASAGSRILTNRRYQALILLTGGTMIYLGGLFIVTALAGSKLSSPLAVFRI